MLPLRNIRNVPKDPQSLERLKEFLLKNTESCKPLTYVQIGQRFSISSSHTTSIARSLGLVKNQPLDKQHIIEYLHDTAINGVLQETLTTIAKNCSVSIGTIMRLYRPLGYKPRGASCGLCRQQWKNNGMCSVCYEKAETSTFKCSVCSIAIECSGSKRISLLAKQYYTPYAPIYCGDCRK